MNRFAAVALVSVAAVLATAAPAGAQSPFTDYRQAAQDQYGGQPPGQPPGRPPQDPGPGNPPGRPPDRPPDRAPGRPPGSGTAPTTETGGAGQGGQGQGQAGQGQAAAADLLATTSSLFFLSPVDPVVVTAVNAVLARLGEPPAQPVSLTEPLNVAGIGAAAGDTRYGKVTAERLGLIRALGARIGRELVTPSPFLTQLGPVLFTGLTSFEPQKYVVFARTGGKLDEQATKVRNAFEKGLVRGVRSTRIPTAGVETTRTEPSQIKWYKARKLSSVDNVDTLNGQRALLAILRDRAKGHFGVKDTAQRLLPKSVKINPAAATIGDAKGDSDTGFGTGLAITLLALMGAWTTLAVMSRIRRSRQTAR